MLEIPDCKKVILYAPTFREYMLDDLSQCTLSVPIDFQSWHEILGDRVYCSVSGTLRGGKTYGASQRWELVGCVNLSSSE